MLLHPRCCGQKASSQFQGTAGTELAAAAHAQDERFRLPSSFKQRSQQGRNCPTSTPGAQRAAELHLRLAHLLPGHPQRPAMGPAGRAPSAVRSAPAPGRLGRAPGSRAAPGGRGGRARGAEQLAPGLGGSAGARRASGLGQKERIKPRWQLRGDG